MKFRLTCLLYCLLLFLLTAVHAQESNQFHLDLYNGLPSNLLYGIVQDNFGYMWICTDKGLVRYNGYGVKIYTTEDGLPTNDVWGIYPDFKKRLWLFAASGRVGYILNGKYKDAYIANNTSNFYIKGIKEYEHGIRFFNERGDTPGMYRRRLYTELNDTIRLSGSYFNPTDLLENGNMVDWQGDTINTLHLNADGTTGLISWCTYDESASNKTNAVGIFYNSLCRYTRFASEMTIVDLKTCATRKKYFRDAKGNPDPICMFIWGYDRRIVAITRQTISILDSNLDIQTKYPVSSLISDTGKINGFRISGFIETGLWGKCIATQNSGLYFNSGTEQHLDNLLPADLSDYTWIGNATGDTASYWWSYKDRKLVTIDEQGHTKWQHYPAIYDVVKMAPYTADTSLLIEKGGPYFYVHATGKVMPLFHHWTVTTGNKTNNWNSGITLYVRDAATAGQNHFYAAGAGFLDCTWQHDSVAIRLIDVSRYYNLRQDALRKIYWAYYNDKVMLYIPQKNLKLIAGAMLKNLGIASAEDIAIHPSSGNIFIKDHTRLLLIDPLKGTMTSLFKNYNLQEAKFCLQGNRLILAGKFGILFSDIPDGKHTGEPLLFPNLRNSHYFQVLHMAVMKTKLVLKTDKGTYVVTMPPGKALSNTAGTLSEHKIILQYLDTLRDATLTDKLNITTASDKLLLDVISPAGNGLLRYQYRIEELGDAWHELNGNELKLPPLEPDKNYHLRVMASDNVWVSDELPLMLYIVPEWWQTKGWSAAIKISLFILLVLILASVVLLTRYFVKKTAKRREILNTLELRAIHAQINPHFIFNTLNTALYFIKKEKTDEAAEHVGRFSRLLRGYLESAHKRYTSIADEISSTRNYIELQQTRFEDMFTYEIIVKDDLYTDMVHIPSLLLQPLVENAINHGLAPRGSGGHLSVIFQKDSTGAGIICTIDDNGIGRMQSAANKRNSELGRVSHGSRLTEELVDVFNRYEKMGIDILYIDKELPETGTTVTITIKQPRYER